MIAFLFLDIEKGIYKLRIIYMIIYNNVRE